MVRGELLQADADVPVALLEGQLPEGAKEFRSVKWLRAVSARDAAGALKKLEPLPRLLEADLTSMNGRSLSLGDVEAFVTECAKVPPALRSYLAKHQAPAAATAGLEESVADRLRNILAQLRPALEPARAEEPAQVEQLLRRIDEAVPPARGAVPALAGCSMPQPTSPGVGAWAWLAAGLLVAVVAAALFLRGR